MIPSQSVRCCDTKSEICVHVLLRTAVIESAATEMALPAGLQDTKFTKDQIFGKIYAATAYLYDSGRFSDETPEGQDDLAVRAEASLANMKKAAEKGDLPACKALAALYVATPAFAQHMHSWRP